MTVTFDFTGYDYQGRNPDMVEAKVKSHIYRTLERIDTYDRDVDLTYNAKDDCWTISESYTYPNLKLEISYGKDKQLYLFLDGDFWQGQPWARFYEWMCNADIKYTLSQAIYLSVMLIRAIRGR